MEAEVEEEEEEIPRRGRLQKADGFGKVSPMSRTRRSIPKRAFPRSNTAFAARSPRHMCRGSQQRFLVLSFTLTPTRFNPKSETVCRRLSTLSMLAPWVALGPRCCWRAARRRLLLRFSFFRRTPDPLPLPLPPPAVLLLLLLPLSEEEEEWLEASSEANPSNCCWREEEDIPPAPVPVPAAAAAEDGRSAE